MRAVRAALLGGLVLGAAIVLAVPARARSWSGFQIIEWQPRPEAAYTGLARLGVTAAMLVANRDHPGTIQHTLIDPIAAAGLRYFVENITTDFFAPYHRWRPGQAVNALYDATIARWRDNPSDPTVFWREPSLVDPAWRGRVRARLIDTVRAHAKDDPLYFDLGDETGIADLTAAWDFDRAPASFAAMREWLRTQYESLDALNAEWGTRFEDWDDVVPDTTFAAMRRIDGNYASWSDFKEWMDVSFAAAVRAGAEAVHDAAPGALAAIEGAQRAGWGGYDYARLAPAVDVMEIYPDDTNLDIAEDLHPGLRALTTAFAADPPAIRAVWGAVLRGSRGLVLWDEDASIVRDDGTPAPRGLAMAPLLSALRGEAGTALVESEPVYGPVAILYSQASFRAQWMLDQAPRGDAWVARGSDGENDDNSWRAAMRGASDHLLRLGVRPRWISPPQLAGGMDPAIHVLFLPHTLALSDAETRAIHAFAARGGLVLADVPPGAFDGHVRRRPDPPPLSNDIRIAPDMLATPSPVTLAALRRLLAASGAQSEVSVTRPDGTPADDVEIRLRRRGDTLLVGLLRSPPEDATTYVLNLTRAGRIRELIGQRDLGDGGGVSVAVPSAWPSLVAITEVADTRR
jgi:hypothetical protein